MTFGLLTGKDIEKIYAKKGIIDFSNIEFYNDQIYELEGEFQIIDGKLVDKTFFENNENEIEFINIPSNWSQLNEGKGCATYRLVVKNLPVDKFYGIETTDIRSASKVIVNDEVIIEDGKISANINESKANNLPQIGYFKSDRGSIDIIIQVSNYEYKFGGIVGGVSIASGRKMQNSYILAILKEIIIITLLCVIGIIYWLLKFMIPKSKNLDHFNFLLAISSILIIIINGLSSHKVLYFVFSNLEFNFASKTLSFSLGMLSFLAIKIVRVSYLKVINVKVWQYIKAYYFASLFLIIFTNYRLYLVMFDYFLLINNLLSLGILSLIITKFIKDRRSDYRNQNLLLLFGMLNYNIYYLDLTLYYTGLKNDISVTYLSIGLYSLFLMILLLYRIDLLVRKNIKTTKELKKINKNLLETIDKSEKYQLAYLKAQIKPHFLFNTLTTIISYCDTDKNKVCQLIEKLSLFLKNNYEFYPYDELTTIKKELELIETYLFIQKHRFGQRLEYNLICDSNLENFKIPHLMIQPLIENALIHGILKRLEGGKIELQILEDDSSLVINVYDNGVGFDSVSSSNNKTSDGVGLKNIEQRLKILYDEVIEIKSNPGETIVKFKVPKI